MRPFIISAFVCAACGGHMMERPGAKPAPCAPCDSTTVTFGDDVAFLQKHTDVVVLGEPTRGPAVAVVPEYQCRVMTSSATGAAGKSFGFINREIVGAHAKQPHMTVFGGEDRFWLGPEGGQFGLYFPPGTPYDLEHWQVPEALDWGPWEVSSRTASEVHCKKRIVVKNCSGTELIVDVDRTVRVLAPERVAQELGASVPAVVAYESENTITNAGKAPWTKATGLPSIWILGMYLPSPTTTVVIPFNPGPEATLGKIVNDAYFGKIPGDRLRIEETALFFSGDGKQRGKIGIPAPRARPVAGSYDSAGETLTVIQYTPPRPGAAYVNSMWETQKDPYGGDVVNSYNDGPPAPGKKPLGPFYELETSSPGAALAPGESLTHVHRTFHLQGPASALAPIAEKQLGVTLERIAAPAR